MKIIIVAPSTFLRKFRNLEFFTLDLGMTRRMIGSENFRKVDEINIKYKQYYNRDILKFGNIGQRVLFYEDLKMEDDQYIIFTDDDIYEITYTESEIGDLENYILSTLQKVDNIKEEEKQIQENNKHSFSEKISDESDDVWVANDDKNYNKHYAINQKLSKDEYSKAILEKFMKK